MSDENRSPHDLVLSELADETPEPGHMAAMMAGTRQRLDNLERRRRRIRHSAIGSTLGLVVAAILLLVPVSYEAVVGTRLEVVWTSPGADMKKIESDLILLDGLIARKFDYKEDQVIGTLIFKDRSESQAVQDVKTVLTDNLPTATSPTFSTTDIKRRVGGNAWAALTKRYFKVSGTGLTHRELELVIMEELGLMGMVNPEASVTQEADGTVHIKVEMESSPVDSFTFEVTF